MLRLAAIFAITGTLFFIADVQRTQAQVVTTYYATAPTVGSNHERPMRYIIHAVAIVAATVGIRSTVRSLLIEANTFNTAK